MNILSDHDIRQRLDKGELVERGLPEHAEGCSYKFKPGKIFPAGRQALPLDWDSLSEPAAEYLAKPGEIFWVRTNRKVLLPSDICAFWWQTNELSKKGIMLVNMSMVDPGYHGWLACLFVNFGHQVVRITPDTTVARLVFAQLKDPVERPYTYSGEDLRKYDGQLRDTALQGASSFLQVNEQAERMGEKMASFDFKSDEYFRKWTEELERLKGSLDGKLKDVVAQQTDEIRKNLLDALRKLFWPYVTTIATAVFLWQGINWLGDRIRPTKDEQIRKLVDEAVIRATGPALQQAIDEAVQRRLIPSALTKTNSSSQPTKVP